MFFQKFWNYWAFSEIYIKEFQWRSFYNVIAFLITTTVCFYNIEPFLYIFSKYLLTNINSNKFFYDNLIQIFFVYLQISALLSFYFCLPIIIFNWANYFLPSLYFIEWKFLIFFQIYFLVFFIFFIKSFFQFIPIFLDFFLFFENNAEYFPLYFEAHFDFYFFFINTLFFKFFIIFEIFFIFMFFSIILKKFIFKLLFLYRKEIHLTFFFLTALLCPPEFILQIISFCILFFFLEICFFFFFFKKNLINIL